MSSSSLTRSSLMRACADPGNESAWRDLYAAYAPAVWRYVRACGATASEADDLVQQTMVSLLLLFQRGFAYDPQRGRFRNLVRKIARNHLVDGWRRQGRLPVDPQADPADTVAEEADPVWGAAWRQRLLAEALKRLQAELSAEVFEVFRLYVLEQVPVPEVCTRCGVSADVVYQHKHRLVLRLRELAAQVEEAWDDLE